MNAFFLNMHMYTGTCEVMHAIHMQGCRCPDAVRLSRILTLGPEKGFRRYGWCQGYEGKLVRTCGSIPQVSAVSPWKSSSPEPDLRRRWDDADLPHSVRVRTVEIVTLHFLLCLFNCLLKASSHRYSPKAPENSPLLFIMCISLFRAMSLWMSW